MKKMSDARDIVVVAASLGGLQALRKIMSSLPADLPASVFVVMQGTARRENDSGVQPSLPDRVAAPTYCV
ncbi:hypothetical protein LMG28727_06962 [Paraburkholderia kirstenboschensis]|uniref:chemotaxis protein CheB n=1 Tax=Paraburkholderia kirstenboschensis TaxID=1245436 RepID=UPI000B082790|nr:chemotaxis protein CheB [Paraburkholderia kirstenboschensis]CAD6559854.1 hypothetical protein LMG28727_06962 [Paraburkholderia kirstenboschensis]